jgi:(E)-4-hydroxy-3-methyl-but-2-enyl pyrophosphate reductase
MQIKLAKEMGFCPGVRRAIKMAEAEAQAHGSIHTLGTVIHNPQEVNRLSALGVRPVSTVDEVPSALAITAHGAPPAAFERAGECGLRVVDMTCPLVTVVQEKARSLAEQGYFVIVYGDANHQEVKGILGWAGERSVAARSLDEALDRAPVLGEPGKVRKIATISQTTQGVGWYSTFGQELLEYFVPRVDEVAVHNTICAPTRKRQESAAELAKEVDLIIVVGGRDSANTRHLVQLVQETGVASYQVESAADLDPAWFRGKETIGLTAGASTPDRVIEEVAETLRQS